MWRFLANVTDPNDPKDKQNKAKDRKEEYKEYESKNPLDTAVLRPQELTGPLKFRLDAGLRSRIIMYTASAV
jgi:hypothetical protein